MTLPPYWNGFPAAAMFPQSQQALPQMAQQAQQFFWMQQLQQSAMNPGMPPRDFCSVCSDKASGFHYGVLSCEGCKVRVYSVITRLHSLCCRASSVVLCSPTRRISARRTASAW